MLFILFHPANPVLFFSFEIIEARHVTSVMAEGEGL